MQKVATRQADIDKAEADRYKRNCKIDELIKENAELKAKLYKLQSELDPVNEENVEEN